MLNSKGGGVPANIVETKEGDRLRWVRPEVRTLSTHQAQLTSALHGDAKVSFS